MNASGQEDDRLETATRARLARLSSVPVDCTSCRRKVQAEMDALCPSSGGRWCAYTGVLRTWGTLAAAMLVIVATLFLTLGSPSPAVASPGRMVALHRAMVAGEMGVEAADLEALREVLRADWDGEANLPALSDEALRACCLHGEAGGRMMGVLLRHEGQPVSAVIAMGEPEGDGQYQTHELEGVRMVMVDLDGKTLCLMGEVPTETLMRLAEAATAR